MKRLFTAIGVLGLASSMAAAPTPASQMDQHKMAKGNNVKPVTVTGCLTKGKDASHFTLTDAVKAGEKGGKSYDLMGGDLKAHVGHKVAITGTVGAMTMPDKDKMAMGKDKMPMDKGEHAMAKGKTGSAEPHTMLRVTSVKMIAASCP